MLSKGQTGTSVPLANILPFRFSPSGTKPFLTNAALPLAITPIFL